jgi:hypothetical protein
MLEVEQAAISQFVWNQRDTDYRYRTLGNISERDDTPVMPTNISFSR